MPSSPLALRCSAIVAGGKRAMAPARPLGYRTAMAYVYLLVAIVAEVCATSFLKLSDGFTKPLPTLATVVGYAIAFYCLSLTLRTIPTGIAYAIWSGVGVILIAAVAWIFQGQKLDAAAIVGMALIVSGVIVMNTLSRVGAH